MVPVIDPLMVGIIAEAIKHNVSLTVHESKYIDVGWTGIATAIKASMCIIVHGTVSDGQHTIKSTKVDTMST